MFEKQSGGKIRKTFREPLIVIGRPPDAVAEPLVRNLMRRHFLDEAAKLRVNAAKQQPALGRADVGGYRQVHQTGPGLAEAKIRLLGDLHVLVRSPAEIKRAQLHLRASLIERVLRHGPGSHGTQKCAVLIWPQAVRQVRQIISRDAVMSDWVGKIYLLV